MKGDRENRAFLIDQFRKVKSMSESFVPSLRGSETGIVKTFEDYVGVVEINPAGPDLAGYEIKSHREASKSYISLFTKSPCFPRRANAYLLGRFGIPYEENPNLKRLHTSLFATRFNSFNGEYSFRLIHDRAERAIRIGVYDLATKELVDATAGYTYACLEAVLHKKMKNLFYVSAERRFRVGDGVEEFRFDKAEIYAEPSLDRFLRLIDDGLILYDIRIGSCKSGRSYGKVHDHGSGFRILEPNLRLLYSEHEKVE